MRYYLGVDIGSVSSNFILLDQDCRITSKIYLRTLGNPVQVIKNGYNLIKQELAEDDLICGVGTTGSGRNLAALILGADVIKNEITAHGVAALHLYPEVRTIIEIGGQDSKLILLKDGIVHDFAMNTVCAAGTGSFLDQQASRLNIPIEEFGTNAIMSTKSARIAGRCGVFAESDMIHKQQMGYPLEDILMGLCEALVRNYLNNVAKGKKIEAPIVFQGGVAANVGLKIAFEKVLGQKIEVAEHYNVMGAVGAALLAREEIGTVKRSVFKGDDFINQGTFKSTSIVCQGCPNICEVISIAREGEVIAYWGDRCKKWEASLDGRGAAATVGFAH